MPGTVRSTEINTVQCGGPAARRRSNVTAAIECKGLIKIYRMGFFLRPCKVLHGVDLQVEPGEIYGFLGPNGAGKTTTIKVILGLAHCDGGTFSFFGEPQKSVKARKRIGFLPDNPYFYDELTGLQTLALAGRMFDLTGKEVVKRSEELLERVGLNPAAWKMPVRKYSRGMLQRLGLAQALIGNPDLLICDEPMEGLDPIGRHEVRDLLRQLKSEGKTIFFSTHILSDVEIVCDRIGVIVGGKVHRTGTLAELLQPRIKAYEVTVAGVPADLITRFDARCEWVRREEDGTTHLRMTSKDMAQELVQGVTAAQGTLISLVPVRESLDEYFYQLVSDGKEAATNA